MGFHQGQQVLVKSKDIALKNIFLALACRHDIFVDSIHDNGTVTVYFIGHSGNKIADRVNPEWIVPVEISDQLPTESPKE